MRESFADDFAWHQRAEWPGRAIYTVEDLPKLREELEEFFPEFELETLEYHETPDHVVVETRISTRLSGGEDRVEGIVWHVWRLAGGVLQEVHVYTDRGEAFEAAAG